MTCINFTPREFEFTLKSTRWKSGWNTVSYSSLLGKDQQSFRALFELLIAEDGSQIDKNNIAAVKADSSGVGLKFYPPSVFLEAGGKTLVLRTGANTTRFTLGKNAMALNGHDAEFNQREIKFQKNGKEQVIVAPTITVFFGDDEFIFDCRLKDSENVDRTLLRNCLRSGKLDELKEYFLEEPKSAGGGDVQGDIWKLKDMPIGEYAISKIVSYGAGNYGNNYAILLNPEQSPQGVAGVWAAGSSSKLIDSNFEDYSAALEDGSPLTLVITDIIPLGSEKYKVDHTLLFGAPKVFSPNTTVVSEAKLLSAVTVVAEVVDEDDIPF